VIIEKHRFSAFVGTNLSIVLRSIGADSLLFAGVATEVCVESSLRDGLFNDFYVSLVEDCSASYSAEAHSASVAVVRQHFGSVTSSEELLSLWQQAPVGVDAR
jgi:nicotinamidase-related amidase